MGRPDRIDRAAAERAGRRAETWAALWLMLKGYRVLARRFRCDRGEIDLVVARGRTLAFVEVKARPDHESARLAITPSAEQRICAAGAIWLARHRPHHQGNIRYDVITIARGLPRHQLDAWRPDSGKGRVNHDAIF